MNSFTPSPMQKVCVDGFELFVKRDDLLRLDGPQAALMSETEQMALSGNKARKFLSLLERDCSDIKRLVSYGSAQGNGLVALGTIAKLKGLVLEYYVDHIGEFLKQNPIGNYSVALSLGVDFHEVRLKQNGIDQTLEQYVNGNILQITDGLYVPEGGACELAQLGVYQLADELMVFFDAQDKAQMKVMLPSGTGTMAWYLQQRFAQKSYPIEVWTCACVGSQDYLHAQFKRFARGSRLTELPPLVLNPDKKYHFGKLYRDFWYIWQNVYQQTGIEFELLYDSLGWLCLLEKLNSQPSNFLPLKSLVVYIHQGGVLGNQSMRNRYRRKYT